MIKSASIPVIGFLVAASAFWVGLTAHAQTTSAPPTYTVSPSGTAAPAGSTAGTFPILYNSAGEPANTASGASLPAGYYYKALGGQGQVYYYGNGTYYDPSTGTYGGSVSDLSGAAGTYYMGGNVGASSYSTPGLPDTGAGGDAPGDWITLFASGAIALGGALYLMNASRQELAA